MQYKHNITEEIIEQEQYDLLSVKEQENYTVIDEISSDDLVETIVEEAVIDEILDIVEDNNDLTESTDTQESDTTFDGGEFGGAGAGSDF